MHDSLHDSWGTTCSVTHLAPLQIMQHVAMRLPVTNRSAIVPVPQQVLRNGARRGDIDNCDEALVTRKCQQLGTLLLLRSI